LGMASRKIPRRMLHEYLNCVMGHKYIGYELYSASFYLQVIGNLSEGKNVEMP